MVMPGRRSGLDLVQEIGERWPTLPTMLMTGYSDAAIAATRENISVLRKPYTIERLSTEIQATLRLREGRSEEHTSELQSLMRNSYADFCLKKKKQQKRTIHKLKYTNNSKKNKENR